MKLTGFRSDRSASHDSALRRIIAAAVAVLLISAGLLPLQPAAAFNIDVKSTILSALDPHEGEGIHEDISVGAVQAEMGDAVTPLLRTAIEWGVRNADVTHQFDDETHFDNASVAKNVGVDEALNRLRQRFESAVALAGGNDQVFNPQYESFRAITVDMIDQLQDLAVDGECVLKSVEHGCPKVADLLARALELDHYLAWLVLNPNPDPHHPTSETSVFAPQTPGNCRLCGVLGPLSTANVKSVQRVRDALNWVLGPHYAADCDCKRTLEQILGADHDDVKVLNRAFYAAQAYLVHQDIGHALHTVEDFFAHTNYVELMATPRDDPKGVEVGTPITVPAGSIPVPSSFDQLTTAAGLAQFMGAAKWPRLESGAVQAPWLGGADVCLEDVDGSGSIFNPAKTIEVPLPKEILSFFRMPDNLTLGIAGGKNPAPEPVDHPADAPRFNYCHYDTSLAVGLNKDDPHPEAGKSHVNYYVAKAAALDGARVLWREFMRRTGPAASAKVVPEPSAAGWNKDEKVAAHMSGTHAAGRSITTMSWRLDDAATVSVPGNVAVADISGAGVHTLEYWATDDGGRRSPIERLYVRIDTGSPTSAATAPAPSASGWYTAPVPVALGGSDAGSGVARIDYTVTGADPQGPAAVPGSGGTVTLTKDGASDLTYAAVDLADNVETPAQHLRVRIDSSAPKVTCAQPDDAWHAGDVSLQCSAGDTTSGLANSGDASFTLSTSVPNGMETAEASTNTRVVCDVASNCTTVGPFGGIKVDKKAPEITITSPADQSAHVLGTDLKPVVTCTDGGSGVATCDVPATLSTSSVGTKTWTVSTADKVGNAASRTSEYRVTYGICKLYAEDRATSGVVPIKVQLCDAAGTDVSTSSVTVDAVGYDGTDTPPPYAGDANTGHRFRYDATLPGYIYNLDAKNAPTGVHVVRVVASGDPVPHDLRFTVR